MANTTTANFGWQMPDPGGSSNTWGSTLNATTQAIDAQVFANQQAGVAGQSPVGSGALWFAATPPTNWLICNGAALSTTTYAALFAVIGYAFGGSGATFNLPNLAGRFPFGAGSGVALGAQGGAANATLAIAQLPSHSHPIVDVAHTHGTTQTPHAHPDSGHTHAASGSQDPHSHSMGGSFGFGVGVTAPPSPLMSEGAQNTASAQPNVYVTVAASGANIGAADADISINPSLTGLFATGNAGSGQAVPTMPPFASVNFIIRYQ